MKLSVVIPTKDRHGSLSRLLASLVSQTYKPRQIVIVTGSSDKQDIVEVVSQYPGIEASVVESQASVCIQRNKGIDVSDGDHILLCDDDIELPSNYLQEITEYIQSSHAGAVSGLVIQPDDSGLWRSQYPPSRLLALLWRFFFQLSVWGEVDQIKTNAVGRVFLSSLKSFYRWRANTFTWAGWPLITDFSRCRPRASCLSSRCPRARGQEERRRVEDFALISGVHLPEAMEEVEVDGALGTGPAGGEVRGPLQHRLALHRPG